MIRTLCDTGELPPAEGLAYFDECQVRSAQPMRVTAEPVGFRSRVRALDLAVVNVLELTCTTADMRRTRKLVRRSDPELYSIVLPLRGTLLLAQGERDAAVGAGEMALYTSSHPFDVHLDAGRDDAGTMLMAQVPRALLPVPERRIDHLAATRLPGASGVGAMFAAFLTRLTTDATAYTPADASRLGSVAVDLLTTVLAHHLDDEPPAGAHATALLASMQAYIQRHLGDPRLSPASVAAAHHISVSYLHRLFRSHELTAAAWIRHQRLERARRDLADATHHDAPVHRIATRWGFADHATFTRAFRAAYGLPPRDYRRRALDASPIS